MNEFMTAASNVFWWALLVLCGIGLVLSVGLLAWSIGYAKKQDAMNKKKPADQCK